MNRIKINWNIAGQQIEELQIIKKELEEYKEAIDRIAKSYCIRTRIFSQFYGYLAQISEKHEEVIIGLENLENALSNILRSYNNCENDILGNNFSINEKIIDTLFEIISQFGIPGSFVGLCKGVVSSKTKWDLLMNTSKGTTELMEKFAHMVTKPKANWRDFLNLSKIKKESFSQVAKEHVTDLFKGKNGVETFAKRAGNVINLATEGIENYNEYQGFSTEMVTETVIETGTSIGLNLLVGTVATAVLGTVGAPAVVASVATVAIVATANILSEKFTGKDIGEHLSDALTPSIVRGIEKIGNEVGKFAKAVSNTSTKWANRIVI